MSYLISTQTPARTGKYCPIRVHALPPVLAPANAAGRGEKSPGTASFRTGGKNKHESITVLSPIRVAINPNSADGPMHSPHDLTIFHGFYVQHPHRYLPIIVCEPTTGLIVIAWRRHGTPSPAPGAADDVTHIAHAFQRVDPRIRLRVRADAGIGIPVLYELRSKTGTCTPSAWRPARRPTGGRQQGNGVFVVMPAKAGIQRGVNGRRFLFSWPKPPRRPARVVSRPTPSRGQALRGNDENAIARALAARHRPGRRRETPQ